MKYDISTHPELCVCSDCGKAREQLRYIRESFSRKKKSEPLKIRYKEKA